MQKRIGNQSSAKFQPRSPGTSMEISDSSDDDRGQPPAAAVRGNPGQANRAGTGSSSAHSSRHAGPSSSELSESDDAGSRRGARKAVPVYKTPSRAPSRAGGREWTEVRLGSSSRPTTAGMNRGLGGGGAGDDIEMIEHAIDRQQHGIKRAGNNAVTRAVNAARHHSHRQSDSEISASSEEEQRVNGGSPALPGIGAGAVSHGRKRRRCAVGRGSAFLNVLSIVTVTVCVTGH
jgi:hypothetical protein